MRTAPLIFALALSACQDGVEPVSVELDAGPAPDFTAPEPVIKRLTATQYAHAVTDLFGEDLALPASLEPDSDVEGLNAVGAGITSVSPLGVEQYEDAAFLIAGQAMQEPARRDALVACTPAGDEDPACAEEVLEALGRRAWRRPLEDAELAALVDIAGEAGATLGDFDAGLEFAIAALLQSPYFIYRVEIGEPDPDAPGSRRYTDFEMASRLSFLLWDTLPTDALLDDAAAGKLTDDAQLAEVVAAMLEDDARAHQGVRALFTDILDLDRLDELNKDPLVFVAMSDEVAASAREETLRSIDAIVLDDDADYRELLTTHRTFIDRKLAQLYNVPAPREDFDEVWLPADGTRRGLLGQASFLALQSHAVSTSVTRRGLFVREKLLCQTIPPPPADVATNIPEASEDAPTMRDRVALHLEDPVCATCHTITDPIGLGLENFDGLGMWRETENGVTIDASGELDGTPFVNAWELASALHDHPALAPCLARTTYKYAVAGLVEDGQEDLVDWHGANFALSGFRVRALLQDIATSPGFRTVSEVQP